MPVGNFRMYDEAIEAMFRSELGNLATMDVTCILLASAHTPDMANHDTYSDVSANEVSGDDYAQLALSGKTLVDVTNGVRWTAGNMSWGNPVTIPHAKYAVLVAGTAGALNPTDKLIAIVDLDTGGGTIHSSNAEYTIGIPANGIIQNLRA